VEYQSKDGSQTKVFDALEWIAAMCSHVPGKGEQMIRYYSYYSNVSRSRRKKARTDDQISYILEPEFHSVVAQGVVVLYIGIQLAAAHNLNFFYF
jgi:hypothetical protein